MSRIDLTALPVEVREVCEAASAVWIGRYAARSGVQRHEEWGRLAVALEAIGLRCSCPTCGHAVTTDRRNAGGAYADKADCLVAARKKKGSAK